MTMTLLDNIVFATPEMIIAATAILALLADLFCPKRTNLTLALTAVGLISAGVVTYFLLGNYKTILLGGLFVSDDLSQLMKLFILLIVLLCFLYSKRYIQEHNLPRGEYYVLGLCSTLGMMTIVSGHSLLTLYLGLELLSLPLYAMTALQRNNNNASEAAMKYFVMGTIASGMLLYGFSLLYGATGQLELLNIANAVSANWQQDSHLILFALVFIIAGVGFKLAAAPFHFWAPDVYEGAPTSVTLLISTAPKIAAIGMAFRLFVFALPAVALQWQQILIVLALLSTGIGNMLALVQSNIKRLLAYSAISHAGFALFGLLSASEAGYAACLYYALIYALMTVAAFGLLTLLSQQGIEVEWLDDLKGLNSRNPWLAFMMLIVLFSMAGVPPTVGFIAKLLVLKALVDAHLIWLAIAGLLFAVVGAYYYIRIVKVMYFEEAPDAAPVRFSLPMNLIFSSNCLALLYLGIFPAGLMSLCVSVFKL